MAYRRTLLCEVERASAAVNGLSRSLSFGCVLLGGVYCLFTHPHTPPVFRQTPPSPLYFRLVVYCV
jgi:hypothetical protein